MFNSFTSILSPALKEKLGIGPKKRVEPKNEERGSPRYNDHHHSSALSSQQRRHYHINLYHHHQVKWVPATFPTQHHFQAKTVAYSQVITQIIVMSIVTLTL